ncbi:MAG: tyrosine--tRNA ligase [Rickettsiaceae bacterium]|nr:tyrosine--tRNA ligase [Rickettsiaceae bacterium]
MNFLEEFKKRGYFYQCTHEIELAEKMKQGKIAGYIGFDCTAESLHVGNLMQIMILRLMQKCGHKPIILVGGATTKIGDPTGKDKTRAILTAESLQKNMEGIKKSLRKFIKFGDGPTDAVMVDNSEWLEKIGYIEFLQEMGREFSVNRMLTMDSVKSRLEREQSLTFLEFNYMLLQAYDFYYLNKNYECILQMGGSDQWGNIVMGVELIRKTGTGCGFGLTTPLLTTSSGKKMGKSESGAVWINEEQLSPYEYFQYWRNTEDADVLRFAKLYCEFSDEELSEFETVLKQDINKAKKTLAYKVTEICHGTKAAEKALHTAEQIFEQAGYAADLPSLEIIMKQYQSGLTINELLFDNSLSSSKSEARRLIRGGGLKINDKMVEDENMQIIPDDFADKQFKLSLGKKRHLLVKLI